MHTSIFVALIQMLFLLILSNAVSADDLKCVTGKTTSTSLITQLEQAKKSSDLTKLIYSKYNLGAKKTEAGNASNPTCIHGDCSKSLIQPPTAAVSAAVFHGPQAPTLAYKHECLVTSNQASSSRVAQFDCPSGKKVNSSMCITDEQLSYQNAVISNFVNCTIKSGFMGIDLNAIYQKLSIETGFRPQYASSAGVGMGQLTSIFVDDIHQKHRGFKFLKRLANSPLPECEIAKMIAKKDVNKKPPLSDRCSYISTGEGFERNVLYSLIGTATIWEKNLEPKLRKYLKKHAKDPHIEEVKKLSIINAYGRGGPSTATAAIRRLSHLSPKNFIAHIKKPLRLRNRRSLNRYIIEIEKRQTNIAAKLAEPIRSEFKTHGVNACLNTF